MRRAREGLSNKPPASISAPCGLSHLSQPWTGASHALYLSAGPAPTYSPKAYCSPPTPALTPTERRLFEALREASSAPVSREELFRVAFGTEEDDGRLNLYICYLRKKIEADGKKRIFACRGKGYYYQC